jgi:hypothetical protein
LPKRPRKNLFDILKIQHREIRNSNILAYFFDPNEEHGFGTLFFESLQQIAGDKIAAHPHIKFNDITSFDEIKSVSTEEYTSGVDDENKSIDIVLEGDKWVIGIENKIHHHLANPLDIYWSHLESKKKTPFGILLTLFPYNIDKGKIDDQNYFLNITHKELLERVQQNIQFTGEVSSTDLFYLREYFKSIESHYFHLKPQPLMDTIVQEITENYSTIDEILKEKAAAENYIENQISAVFSEYGYVKAKNWYRREDKKFDLYFYISPASELMKMNCLRLCFEIRNRTNQPNFKEPFLHHFQNEFTELQNFKQDDLKSDNQRTHAFIYAEHNFFQKGTPFKTKFQEVLARLIIGHDAPVLKVEKYLEQRNKFYTG